MWVQGRFALIEVVFVFVRLCWRLLYRRCREKYVTCYIRTIVVDFVHISTYLIKLKHQNVVEMFPGICRFRFNNCRLKQIKRSKYRFKYSQAYCTRTILEILNYKKDRGQTLNLTLNLQIWICVLYATNYLKLVNVLPMGKWGKCLNRTLVIASLGTTLTSKIHWSVYLKNDD